MGAAIDARDPYTRGHSDRVGSLSARIAKCLGIDKEERQRIYLSGLLHDVGKIGIRDDVLLKSGRLTEEETAQMRSHPEVGRGIVQQVGELNDLLPGILHHHESIDGSGYPHGLSGEQIPLMARIIAVSDAYDAMTSDRPYRKGFTNEKAFAILQNGAGVQWDRNVVEAFLNDMQERGAEASGCADSCCIDLTESEMTELQECHSDSIA